MSQVRLRVRLRDRPDALERVIGMLRRRAFAIPRLSTATTETGQTEVVLRVDTERTPVERVRVELLGLVDVLEVDEVAAAATGATRELLLAWIDGEEDEAPPAGGRLVADGAGGRLIEITGAPEEIDAALARLGARGALPRFVRSGEVAAPGERGQEPERSER